MGVGGLQRLLADKHHTPLRGRPGARHGVGLVGVRRVVGGLLLLLVVVVGVSGRGVAGASRGVARQVRLARGEVGLAAVN